MATEQVGGQASGENEQVREQVPVGPDRLLYLLPEELTIPEVLDVRPWSTRVGNTEAEVEAIQQLAQTIADEGQIQPVRVRYSAHVDGEDGLGLGGQAYELVAGRRRVQAVALINAGKSEGEAPLRVKCVIGGEDVSTPHAFRQALIENVHRAGISPMDFAQDIATLMEKMGWKDNGGKGAKKVAQYLRVSSATVTQHLRLLKLAPEVQEKVHKGELSREAAFVVTDVPVEQQAAVVEQAEQAQQQEEKQEGVSGQTKRKTGKVKSRHVKEAARAAGGEKVRPQARSKKEIVEWFDIAEGPAYGYPDGAVHTFVREFRAWVSGESKTDRKLQAAFDALVEKAARGTKASLKAAESKSDSKRK